MSTRDGDGVKIRRINTRRNIALLNPFSAPCHYKPKIHNKILYASSIFKWFKEDFDNSGGVVKFVTNYHTLPTEIKQVKYLSYVWQLNVPTTP